MTTMKNGIKLVKDVEHTLHPAAYWLKAGSYKEFGWECNLLTEIDDSNDGRRVEHEHILSFIDLDNDGYRALEITSDGETEFPRALTQAIRENMEDTRLSGWGDRFFARVVTAMVN